MKISFRMEFAQDSMMLDLERHLNIDDIKCSVPLKKTKRKKDILFLAFDRELKKGENVVLEINYHGSPIHILKYSAISWNKDKNNQPWICTTTQGIGPHHMMPCKNLLYDEPDSCFIRVGVPKDLVAVSNGKLDNIIETSSENVYNWAVRNPINIYNISFNVGHYVKLEKDYQDVDHVDRKIQMYALNYNKEVADTFLDQAPIIMKKLENFFGPYPWWNDGCKIVEASLTNGICMEHQSAIAMTHPYQNQFKHINFTLVHELTHEWWGNNITAYDYADLWLHEGFAEYSEPLFAEVFLGKEYYNDFIHYFSNLVVNKRPIVKPYNVAYNNLVHDDDQDLYNKGVMFLHTLRRQLNDDELFFKILKDAQTRFAKSNITTDQFLAFFNEETKKDFTPFFDVYLKRISPPVVLCHIDKSNSDSVTIKYKWAEKMPADLKMKIILNIDDGKVDLYPSSNFQEITVATKKKYFFDVGEFGYVLFKEIKK